MYKLSSQITNLHELSVRGGGYTPKNPTLIQHNRSSLLYMYYVVRALHLTLAKVLDTILCDKVCE